MSAPDVQSVLCVVSSETSNNKDVGPIYLIDFLESTQSTQTTLLGLRHVK
jgi:hypothetical protein